MFGTETQFANDFAKSEIERQLSEAGFNAMMFDGGVLVEGAEVSEVRDTLNINPAKIEDDGEYVTVYV